MRQYYRLPERGAHTAMGDVETTADLIAGVLQPLAAERGLKNWDDLVSFCANEWFPSRIAFGKHGGRIFWEAKEDATLYSWLEWLAGAKNARSAKMGRWYLAELERAESQPEIGLSGGPFIPELVIPAEPEDAPGVGSVALYVDPDEERLRMLISSAQERLANLSAAFIAEQRAINTIAAKLFRELVDEYRQRDRLQLLINYRKRFLNTLLDEGEEGADEVEREFDDAQKDADAEYESAVRDAAKTTELSDDESQELKRIFKNLARLFHPDRVQSDPERKQTYERLLAVINAARADGNIELLREIEADPDAYIAKRGWTGFKAELAIDIVSLRAEYQALSIRIIECIEELGLLRESEAYLVFEFCRADDRGFDHVVSQRRSELSAEIKELQVEADALREEIQELTGEEPAI